ncbi:hypothetical protein BD410DRAFT_723768, partial [Rickenella mellea]
QVLLGCKKRGFAEGMYNGFGGKVEPGETPIVAAARELHEEACISANLKECGILLFVSENFEYSHYIHIFRAEEYGGVPTETEEMRPEWYSIPPEYREGHSDASNASKATLPPIPYEKMWPDDKFWVPLMFRHIYFEGRADFGEVGKDGKGNEKSVMERWWFGARPVQE